MTDASSSVATPAVADEVKAPAAETPKEEVKEVAKEAPKQEVSKVVVEDDPVSDTEVEEAEAEAAYRRRILASRRKDAPPKASVRGARYARDLPVRSPPKATTSTAPPSPVAPTPAPSPATTPAAPAAVPARRKAMVEW